MTIHYEDHPPAKSCASCFKPCGAEEPPHVDKFHRFTPLCGECYADDKRREATAYLIGDAQ